jgi:Ca2+-binding EF-hand superfamily protein
LSNRINYSSGRLSYNEFIAAALDTHRQMFISDLVEAFNRLDRDGDGGVTLADLESFLPSKKGRVAEELRRAFYTADETGAGVVTWEQFAAQFPQTVSKMPVSVRGIVIKAQDGIRGQARNPVQGA